MRAAVAKHEEEIARLRDWRHAFPNELSGRLLTLETAQRRAESDDSQTGRRLTTLEMSYAALDKQLAVMAGRIDSVLGTVRLGFTAVTVAIAVAAFFIQRGGHP